MADKQENSKNEHEERGCKPRRAGKLNFKRRVLILSVFMVSLIVMCAVPLTRDGATFYDKVFFYPLIILLPILFIWLVYGMCKTRELYINGIKKKVKIEDFWIKDNMTIGRYQYSAFVSYYINIDGNKHLKKSWCRISDLKKEGIRLKKGMEISILQDKNNPLNTAIYLPKLAPTLI